ncbi:MAG: 50S ribosomal protein L15 [Candidatus Ratteibacteria bacterium]
MKLNQLKVPFGAKHKKKRLGRGDSSGHGGTSTRGHKGHKARSGYRLSFNFEGGQMPLFRRLPKRGFTHLKKYKIEIVNLNQIDKLFQDGEEVTIEKLKEKSLIKKGQYVKILGEGKLTKKLTIYAHQFSKKAKEKIEKVGGKVNIVKVKENV